MLATVSPFLHRRYGADIQDHAARRCTRFPHCLAEQIGEVADFHALLHVLAALHRGIKNAGGFAVDAGNALDPHRGSAPDALPGSIFR
jgi:hypothetical protein